MNGLGSGSLEDELAPDVAAALIAEELALEGDAAANLGGFATPAMDPEVDALVLDAIGKNAVDRGAYPVIADFERRCVRFLSGLLHCPRDGIGTSTVGSSEALYMALAAHRLNWRKRGGVGHPNVVSSAGGHVSVQKFAAFFDVELRVANSDGGAAGAIERHIDERTIAVVAVLGTAQTGAVDDVAAIDVVAGRTGVPIHVDAASGGFILPFSMPERRWDFRLANVRSVNLSGHKFGLTYPGIAWLLLRSESDIPAELVHRVGYVSGGEIDDFSLNFTRSATGIVTQYYSFLRHGHAGYRRAVTHALALTRRLAEAVEALGEYRVLSDLEIPVVTFATRDAALDVSVLRALLRGRGWIVAIYPVEGSTTPAMRVVVKASMTADTIDRFVEDLAFATRVVAATTQDASPLSQPG